LHPFTDRNTEAIIAATVSGKDDIRVLTTATEAAASPAFGAGIVSAYDRDATIDALFRCRALARPSAAAVVCDGRTATYGQVEKGADRVANALRALGVRPGATVGVGFERSAELPSVLLGILRCGAAYLPLDPAYPRERLALMVRDCGAALVVTDPRQAAFPDAGAPAIDVRTLLACGDDRVAPSLSEASCVAYVIYTSGSTGRPKGVAVEHRGVARLVCGADYVTARADDVFLHLAPLAFDASTFELWCPLLSGAQVAIPRPGLLGVDEIATAIDRFRVSTLFLTTALFQRFVDAPASPASLRHVLTGGEVASAAHVARFIAQFPHCRLSAVYGPTENTTFSTWCDLAAAPEGRSVPIGRPIANSTAYVLDEFLHPVPDGTPGELVVGGDGVARGYVNLPSLTAQRFVNDPFAADPSARMYRTGDRACRRHDGLLEFLGRFDDQIKVRGFRVEPGEIETALRLHDAVRDCAVVLAELAGEKALVAFVVANGAGSADERGLRAHLARTLPAHMIPRTFILRESLPLNANGKVDRALLSRAAATVPVPPAGGPVRDDGMPYESAIGTIWREILGADRAIDENFFDAGGDSLLLLTLRTRLRERLSVDVGVAALFEHTTIRKLAAHVARSQATA
jgi:amino acid adenylation domain-containing protein